MKGDAGEPLRSALTLAIKEQTISVKHVFSAFTLYANVLRRVKVPFDEARQEFIRKSIHWNRPQEKTRLKVDIQRSPRCKVAFPKSRFISVHRWLYCLLGTLCEERERERPA